MLSNCGVGEDSWESRGLQGDPTSQSNINPEYSLEGLMLKLKFQDFGHLMQRTDSLEKTLMMGKNEGRRRRGQQRMRWVDAITNLVDMSLSNHLQETVKNREAWHTAVHGVKKSQTQLSKWTTKKMQTLYRGMVGIIAIHLRENKWSVCVLLYYKCQSTLVYCPENPRDRGAWWATVHGVAKESDTT